MVLAAAAAMPGSLMSTRAFDGSLLLSEDSSPPDVSSDSGSDASPSDSDDDTGVNVSNETFDLNSRRDKDLLGK